MLLQENTNPLNLFIMKKIIILCVVAMFTTLGYAKPKSIEIVSGLGKIFLDHTKTTTFIFDYDSCYVGEISKGVLKEGALLFEEYIASEDKESGETWAPMHEFAYEKFVKNWNVMNRKRALLVSDSDNPDYKTIFHVSCMDLGSTAAAYFGFGDGGCVTLMGEIEVFDWKTNEQLVTYKVNQIVGAGNVIPTLRMWNAYMELLGDFTRLNMKSK